MATGLETSANSLDVDSVTDPETALKRCRRESIDAIVTADELPDGDGIEFLETVRETCPELPIVLYSVAGDERVASRAIAAGVSEYVPKRDGVERLVERVEAAVEDRVDRSDRSDRHRLAPVTDEGSRTRPIGPRARAMDAAPVGVVITDPGQPDNPIVYANERFQELTGYDESDVLGRNCRFLQGPDTDPSAVDEMQRAVDDEEPVTVELRNYRKDGSPFWNRVTLAPVTDDEGAVTHFVGFQEDITERRRRSRDREATVDLLQGIYDVTTDPELRFGTKIDRLLELGCEKLDLPYGFLSRIESGDPPDPGTQTIVQSSGDHELLQPGESCPLSEAYCRRTIETDGLLAIQDAITAGWEDDDAYDVFELGSYIGGKVVVDGELYGTLCFAASEPRTRPFTAAERTLVRLMNKWASYELERKRAREELESTNDRLEEFASIVSHDLRNPLNVAVARFGLVAEECDSEHIEDVAGAHERMETLIDDLLTLAHEGESATDPQPIALSAAARDCWDTVETGDATLSVETDRTVRADPGQLRELLENLVRNAFEHADTAVTVTVGDLEDGFYVADDGSGIPPEERDDVLESGYTTTEDGTGYGLAIVAEIAESHGWDITVSESEAGGARFEFTDVEVV
ncbi:PAS domain-containing protein [Halorhabdus amylolytica]|uniref:PAS domain-containing protein n=1 Tax=Halorhabdus amylolytica TaxID=2559573 RepID=UPI00145ACB4E|nr:PAS domain-containing protein [Halorhabdus amylolytica]